MSSYVSYLEKLPFSLARIFSYESNDISKSIPQKNWSLGYLIAKVLQAILSKESFCWVSRGTVQLQSYLLPKKWSYWTKITDDIFVGGMPLQNWNHLAEAKRLEIGAVLSINKTYEFQPKLFANPLRRKHWEKNGITWKKISSLDLQPVKVQKLALAVDFVREQKKLGKKVLIHCTGGRGRSVSVAVCCLVDQHGFSLEKAIQHVKICRPQAMLGEKQIKSIVAWHKKYNLKENSNSLVINT